MTLHSAFSQIWPFYMPFDISPHNCVQRVEVWWSFWSRFYEVNLDSSNEVSFSFSFNLPFQIAIIWSVYQGWHLSEVRETSRDLFNVFFFFSYIFFLIEYFLSFSLSDCPCFFSCSHTSVLALQPFSPSSIKCCSRWGLPAVTQLHVPRSQRGSW